MTDLTESAPALGARHTTTSGKSRLRARYRAELRFKSLGLAALATAILFLTIFLYTIVRDGLPGFAQNYLVADVRLDREELDPQGTNDPNVIVQGNFDGIVNRSMRALFPQITDRVAQRAITSLLSSGAPVVLRGDVLRNPGWIGATQRYPLLLDDLADLFLKGILAPLTQVRTAGEMRVSGTRGDVRLTSTASNFGPILEEVRQRLRANAAEQRRIAAGQDRVVRRLEAERSGLQARLAGLAGEERARVEARIAQIETEATAARRQVESQTASAAALDARALEPDQQETLDNNLPSYFVRLNGGVIKLTEIAGDDATGRVILPLASDVPARPGDWRLDRVALPESNRRLTDTQIALLVDLRERGLVEQRLSWQFFTGGASREPEIAGVWSSIVGSAIALLVTFFLSFPIGVAAAVYLEEFAPKNRLTEVIEVNINNLAAVPSIIFGLLGLAIFLNVFDMPRSAPVVGGLVLALMTLPIIIIASRAAIRAVPPSIKEAALGVGASHVQAVTHHVLPLAMPGILTGAIIGMAIALGETAPLLLIGMVAFVVDVPNSITDPATVLPVQIFMWADFPEVAFQNKTAAAIIVLLVFLTAMNAIAVYLRRRFERRW